MNYLILKCIWACCKPPVRLFLKKKLLRQPTFLKRGKVRYIGYKYASRALVSCHILSQTSHSYIYLSFCCETAKAIMLDKSWISLPRSSPQYLVGLNQFLDYAFMHSSVRGKIRCPCEKCKFDKWKTRDEVVIHCLDKQFPRYYVTWAFHGEDGLHDTTGDLEVGSSSHVGRMQVESSDDYADGGHANNLGNNTVMEAFGQHEAGDDWDVVVDGPVAEYLSTEVARDFFELMTEGDKPLYPGINELTILTV